MAEATSTKAKGCQIGARSHQPWSFCIRALLATKDMVAAGRFLNGLACPTVLAVGWSETGRRAAAALRRERRLRSFSPWRL